MKCPVCNGKEFERLKNSDLPLKVECRFCYGRKELDWIENIFGVDSDGLWYPPAGFKNLKRELSNRIENEMSSL